MIRLFFISTIMFVGGFYLTGCRDKTISIVDAIVKYGMYGDMYIGQTDSISPQWRNYEALVQQCSEKELEKLTDHENPIVRCYAFKALTDACSPRAYRILLRHLADTGQFKRFYGCFIVEENVTDNFLDNVGYKEESRAKYTLTKDEYDYIDSVLLYGKEIERTYSWGFIKSISRRCTLKRLKPKPELYKRVREIVTAGVYEAIPLLAQYRNIADTTLFKQLLLDDGSGEGGRTLKNHIRKAIKHFPHPSFYPILRDQLFEEIGKNYISDHYESFPLYTALVQYPTIQTKRLFEEALQMSGDEYHQRSRFIEAAIRRNPLKVFNSLVGVSRDSTR